MASAPAKRGAATAEDEDSWGVPEDMSALLAGDDEQLESKKGGKAPPAKKAKSGSSTGCVCDICQQTPEDPL